MGIADAPLPNCSKILLSKSSSLPALLCTKWFSTWFSAVCFMCLLIHKPARFYLACIFVLFFFFPLSLLSTNPQHMHCAFSCLWSVSGPRSLALTVYVNIVSKLQIFRMAAIYGAFVKASCFMGLTTGWEARRCWHVICTRDTHSRVHKSPALYK